MRLVNNGFQFFDRQSRLRKKLALFIYPGTMRHVHLDPVRTVVELFPSGLTSFDRTINNLHALGHDKFRRVAIQAVASRGRNGARCAEDARSRNGAFFNRLLDFDIAISGTLRL